MERRIINKKLLTGIVAGTLLLSGCAKTEEVKTPETVVVVETVVVTPTPTPTPIVKETTTVTTTTESTHESTTVTTTESITSETTKEPGETNEYGHEEGSLEANLDSMLDGINFVNDKIDNFNYNDFKESTIDYAKQLIDFIFYGGEMNGMTFEELKDEAKEEAYEELQELDAIIMEFVPDYKEQLGDKYNKVKDFASTTFDKAKEIFSGDVDVDIDININIENNKPKKKQLILN